MAVFRCSQGVSPGTVQSAARINRSGAPASSALRGLADVSRAAGRR